ncbi:hypothetical protein, partial [Bacillus amyloliquefaciens]|uniref:hypothetical protein n=1 Tax=Bacillus amyloliquefaciens TaxID=1390 RepID=UPI00197AC5A5
SPVSNGRLAQLDTRSLPDGTQQTLRLTASAQPGGTAETTSRFTVDNAPPSAPVLLTATASGSNVTVTWQQSVSADVLGYL